MSRPQSAHVALTHRWSQVAPHIPHAGATNLASLAFTAEDITVFAELQSALREIGEDTNDDYLDFADFYEAVIDLQSENTPKHDLMSKSTIKTIYDTVINLQKQTLNNNNHSNHNSHRYQIDTIVESKHSSEINISFLVEFIKERVFDLINSKYIHYNQLRNANLIEIIQWSFVTYNANFLKHKQNEWLERAVDNISGHHKLQSNLTKDRSVWGLEIPRGDNLKVDSRESSFTEMAEKLKHDLNIIANANNEFDQKNRHKIGAIRETSETDDSSDLATEEDEDEEIETNINANNSNNSNNTNNTTNSSNYDKNKSFTFAVTSYSSASPTTPNINDVSDEKSEKSDLYDNLSQRSNEKLFQIPSISINNTPTIAENDEIEDSPVSQLSQLSQTSPKHANNNNTNSNKSTSPMNNGVNINLTWKEREQYEALQRRRTLSPPVLMPSPQNNRNLSPQPHSPPHLALPHMSSDLPPRRSLAIRDTHSNTTHTTHATTHTPQLLSSKSHAVSQTTDAIKSQTQTMANRGNSGKKKRRASVAVTSTAPLMKALNNANNPNFGMNGMNGMNQFLAVPNGSGTVMSPMTPMTPMNGMNPMNPMNPMMGGMNNNNNRMYNSMMYNGSIMGTSPPPGPAHSPIAPIAMAPMGAMGGMGPVTSLGPSRVSHERPGLNDAHSDPIANRPTSAKSYFVPKNGNHVFNFNPMFANNNNNSSNSHSNANNSHAFFANNYNSHNMAYTNGFRGNFNNFNGYNGYNNNGFNGYNGYNRRYSMGVASNGMNGMAMRGVGSNSANNKRNNVNIDSLRESGSDYVRMRTLLSQISNKLKELDSNKTGFLTYDKFVQFFTFYRLSNKFTSEQMRLCFDMFVLKSQGRLRKIIKNNGKHNSVTTNVSSIENFDSLTYDELINLTTMHSNEVMVDLVDDAITATFEKTPNIGMRRAIFRTCTKAIEFGNKRKLNKKAAPADNESVKLP